MNTNFLHNAANIVIVALAAITAGLMATGCTQLATGILECSASWIDPTWTAVAITGLGFAKLAVNVIRDGFSGLVKRQPPVE